MQNDSTRNTILFVVCTVAILLAYQLLIVRPQAERQRAAQAEAAAAQSAAGPSALNAPSAAAPGVRAFLERRAAAASSPRVPIASEAMSGSVALQGGRIDDLFLKRYRETLEDDAPQVELFRPQGAQFAYFSEFGWVGQNVPGLPGASTRWTLAGGDRLSPGRPIVLTYDNGAGLTFTRTVSVDDQYMFTVQDTVANRSGAALTLAPYASVQRHGAPADLGKNQIIHEGGVGVFDAKAGAEESYVLKEFKYGKWRKPGGDFRTETDGGWLGITDKYWLAALIPDQEKRVDAQLRVVESGGVQVHEAVFTGQPRVVQPGRQITETTRLFAGAKRQEILDGYTASLGVPRFDSAIDWGNFWFLTRPIFATLEFFFGLVGNFGVAILLLTLLVKAVFFPLANTSYASMSKMKKVAPEVEKLKERFKDDPTKQQQEMLALYKRENINVAAGCLPILVQIPVFYALYKVLTVTIEMRHAPFFGWIQDLSARDPSTIVNLFGLLPFDPAAVPLIGGILNGPLHLGVLPLLYGASMWLQTAMNPPPADPIQRQIFAIFPLVFTFIMAPFAVGLLIYWVWNNVLSIAQQWFIMRRYGADNPIDHLLARFKKPQPKPQAG